MNAKRRFLAPAEEEQWTPKAPCTLRFKFCFLDENLGILVPVFFLSMLP